MTSDAISRLAAALSSRYRIERELGAGGMATVYLAHDIKHDRDVAIKVLHPDLGFALGGERFLTEIKTTARLHHPHILPLLDSGDADGLLYYVMPVVTGEPLRARLMRERQLPIADVLRIASEVGDALDAAHAIGIIHRDIKPENILLQGGHALVADFGIALAVQTAGGDRMTQTGLSLGTPQYMSPEQAMGERTIDARSDIYALGAVTYEMLTGDPPFAGSSVQAIVAKVLTEKPTAPSRIRDTVTQGMEDAVLKALAKLPADRFASAAAFAAALDLPRSSASGVRAPVLKPVAGMPPTRSFAALLLGIAALVAITAGITRWLMHRGASSGARSAHLSIVLPDGYELGSTHVGSMAISPDGSRMAYVGLKDGKNRIFVRELDEPEAKALDGTEGGDGPFFSPDGQWIGFFAGSKLRRIAVGGAALQVLADAPSHRGGTWGDDGFIYFAPTNISGIWRVPEGGGAATEVTHLNAAAGEISHRWPQRVPGSSTLLFSAWTGPGDDEHDVAMQTVGVQDHHLLVKGGDAPVYAASAGKLLYAHTRQLFAVPWRPSQQALDRAVPISAAERVNDGMGNEGYGNFVVSGNGTLAYLGAGESIRAQRLVWVSRTGAITPVPLPDKIYENAAISPDGARAALQIHEGTTGLWIYDFERGTLTPLRTGAGSSQAPLWSADGMRVIYRGTRQGTRNLYWTRVDGSSDEERLTNSPGVIQTPTSLAADGRTLLFDNNGPNEPGGSATWVLRLDADRTPHRLFPPPAAGHDGQVSPDGKWVAYQAPVSSRDEIFVAPFAGGGERRLVSTDGGTEPLWSRDGRELYFQSGTRLMAVTVTAGASFSASVPRLLYDGRFFATTNLNTSYSISKDGTRFLRIQAADQGKGMTRIELVLNWISELAKQGTQSVR